MKAFIVCIAYLALFCGATSFVFANNQNETVSIEERLNEIQYSLNQTFMEASKQMEALKNLFFELKPMCGESNPSPKPPEIVYSSCKDVPPRSGVYRLAVNSSYNRKAFCEMDEFGGGWTVFQKRQDGSVNFNRSWNDYKNGFGSPAGEYWLGLDTLHELTARMPHELLIRLESFNGTIKYEQYSRIMVNSESDKYKLMLRGDRNGTAGDSLFFYRGEIFVTFDVQSGSYYDCAKQLASGFWHYSCQYVSNRNNLNGVYGTRFGRQGIWWSSFSDGTSLYYPLKRVQMMIREKIN